MNESKKHGQPDYEPDWISEKTLRDWTNKSVSTIWRWRTQFNLHYSKMGDTVFYDRKQIAKIMTEHSTYKFDRP